MTRHSPIPFPIPNRSVAAPAVSLRQTPRGALLLVEENESLLEHTAELLRDAGFTVLAVSSSIEAKSSFQSNGFDAVLLDVEVAGNDQLELLQHFLQRQPNVPVVLFTEHPSVETAVASVRLGVVDYITKPACPELLVRRMDAAVQRRRVLRSMARVQALSGEMSRLLEYLESVVSQSPGWNDSGPDKAPLRNLSESERENLTSREEQVLEQLARGRGTRRVAEELNLSVHTVRNYLKSIFIKLGVNSQVALLGKISGASQAE